MRIAKALVVDDSKVAHLTLRKLLTERHIEVDWVGSGEEALAYMARQHPDIIFMDVMMPGMDGFETTAAIINNNPDGAAPPIIMCSANATDEDKQNAKASGALEFFSKPYTPVEMDKILKRVNELPEPAGEPAPALDVVTAPMFESSRAGAPVEPPNVNASVYERIAERAAWATAERVARDVATDIAQSKAEQSAQRVVEQLLRDRLEEAVQGTAKQAAQAAQETVRQALQDITAQAVDAAQANVGKLVRPAAEQAVREISEELIKKQLSRGLMVLRDDLNRQMEQHVGSAVQDILTRTLGSVEFKQQLVQMLKETTLPMAVSVARQAAAEAQQEIIGTIEEMGGRSKPAVILAGVALAVALAAILLHFFY